MTKYTPELMCNMAAFLRNPTFCLVDTQDFADDNTGVAAQREHVDSHMVGELPGVPSAAWLREHRLGVRRGCRKLMVVGTAGGWRRKCWARLSLSWFQ